MLTLLHRWDALPRVAAVCCGPVLELWFWPGEHVWRELGELIVAERTLSPMLVWSLHRACGCPLVRIESATRRTEHVECIAFFIGARRAWAVGPRRRHRVWTSPAE